MIPGLGRCPGEGNGNPLQYSCLENSTEDIVGYSRWDGKESDTTEHAHNLDHRVFVLLLTYFASRFIHEVENGRISFSLLLKNIPLCIYTPSLSIHPSMNMKGVSVSWLFETCCNEHGSTDIPLESTISFSSLIFNTKSDTLPSPTLNLSLILPDLGTTGLAPAIVIRSDFVYCQELSNLGKLGNILSCQISSKPQTNSHIFISQSNFGCHSFC